MITDVAGVRAGHWTDPRAATGCTVVLLPEGTVASGEVRGGAPASRETALLDPTRTVGRLDAVVLTGGSAFGLASADGVMRFCEERGMGVPTSVGPVPIVVALGLFDLAVGDPSVRPGPGQGYAACEAASAGPIALGRVGAGTGATVATGSPGERRSGGLVSATARTGDLVVSALVAVNAFGVPAADDHVAPDLAATLHPQDAAWQPADDRPRSGPAADADDLPRSGPAGGGRAPGTRTDPGVGPDPGAGAGLGNTVIGLVATNARLGKVDCNLLAQSAHDGLARAVFPAHTRFDGDAFVAAATGALAGDGLVDAARLLAVHAVAQAIRSLAAPRDPAPGDPEP